MSTQRLVKTFCDLVSTGSETGHERAFCIELEKALIEAGFEVERDEEAGKKCGSDGFNISPRRGRERAALLPHRHRHSRRGGHAR